jgi:hypothetical protein
MREACIMALGACCDQLVQVRICSAAFLGETGSGVSRCIMCW